MKKCKLAATAWLSVCIVLFTSCGNSAGVSAGSTSEVKSTAVSESTAEEKQPYEILREKEDETKQIAADEEQQVKELQDALNAVNFYYEELLILYYRKDSLNMFERKVLKTFLFSSFLFDFSKF